MGRRCNWTAAEAAFVLEEPVRRHQKGLDEGPIRAALVRKAGRGCARLIGPILSISSLFRALKEESHPKARAELYEALKTGGAETPGVVSFGRLSVDVLRIFSGAWINALIRLAELHDLVEFRADGEASSPGPWSRSTAYAALLEAERRLTPCSPITPRLTA